MQVPAADCLLLQHAMCSHIVNMVGSGGHAIEQVLRCFTKVWHEVNINWHFCQLCGCRKAEQNGLMLLPKLVTSQQPAVKHLRPATKESLAEDRKGRDLRHAPEAAWVPAGAGGLGASGAAGAAVLAGSALGGTAGALGCCALSLHKLDVRNGTWKHCRLLRQHNHEYMAPK